MYVFHRDIPNNQWNVFKEEGEQESYICSFDTLEAARDFCERQNAQIYESRAASLFSVIAREGGE